VNSDLSQKEHRLVDVKRWWADLPEDKQTPAHQKTRALEKGPADLFMDEKSPDYQKSSLAPWSKVGAQVSVAVPAAPARWADLPDSEDEQEGSVGEGPQLTTHSSISITDDKEPQPGLATEEPVVMEPSRPSSSGSSRPQFARPTREARVRQFQAKLDEFFELDFDSVDPSQQDGLTHRMLFALKSLAELVNFWQADGTQVSEEGFKLLGFEEADMFALGRVIRKTDKLLDERRFRDAYDKLCTARRWFDPNTVMEERAKASALSAKRDNKKACDSDADDDWTQVKKTDKKRASDAAPQKEYTRREQARWKSSGNKGMEEATWKNVGNKASQELEAVSKAASKLPTQTSSLRPQHSNPKFQTAQRPQASGLRPLSNLKPQTSAFGLQASGSGLRRKPLQKLLCRYNVCIEQDRAFNVVRKLLGDRGSHMKQIAENTGAKLRIRGRGSGFLEGPDQTEASDEPLMLCISASSREGFENAVQDVERLLEHVQDQYRVFCNDRHLPVPRLSVVQREQPTR